MARISLTNPTGRNTKAHIVSIGLHDFYFSYETCIAYRGPKVSCRIFNYWGPTTGRHFKELGCSNFVTVDRAGFDDAITNYGDPLVSFEAALLALVFKTRQVA